MDFLELMQTRYTTKYYDAEKKIAPEILDKIIECARLTPTAVNIQSTKLFLMTDKEGKAKVRPAFPDFNVRRFDDCAAALVLCGRTEISEELRELIVKAEIEDKRFWEDDVIASRRAGLINYPQSRAKLDGIEAWTCKQAYITMATILYAAAAYGVDSTPIEGVDIRKIDELLKLREQGLCAVGLVLLGYRAENDSNTLIKRPKSRLKTEDILIRL